MQCLGMSEYRRARKHLRKAIELSPNVAAFHWGLGSVYYHQPTPDYRAAIDEFRRVIELKPEWVEGHHCLAFTLVSFGDLEQSIPHYEKAMELAPTDPRPVISYGICLTKLNRYEAAIRMLRHAIELNPHYGNASAHLFLADALLADGQIREACREWEFALTLEPVYPEHGSAHESAREMLAKYKR